LFSPILNLKELTELLRSISVKTFLALVLGKIKKSLDRISISSEHVMQQRSISIHKPHRRIMVTAFSKQNGI